MKSNFSDQSVNFYITEAGEGQAFLVGCISSPIDTARAATALYTEVAEFLNKTGAEIVQERLFGSLSVAPVVQEARKAAFLAGNISAQGPINFIQGHPPWGTGLAGVIIRTVSTSNPSDKVWTIQDQGIPLGTAWRRQGNTFLILQNVITQGSNRTIETQQLFNRADRLLRAQGATFRDVARTWFYLSGILDWYPVFNQVRNEKYQSFGIMPEKDITQIKLPASTGIGGENLSGSAASMDLLAIIGESADRLEVEQMSSEHQLDAFCYGSAFSRGALIEEPDVTLIELSGTAAIDKAGRSLYPGNIQSQVDSTLDTISALLASKGASLKDICAATLFVKRAEDDAIFWKMAARRGLESLPGVCIVADICREDLLFEMDAEVAFNRTQTFKGMPAQ